MKNKGFTLVELLAVIVILAIILAIAVPGISGIIKNVSKSAFESDLKLVLKSLSYKKLENDAFDITTINETNMQNQLGLSNANYQSLKVEIINNEPSITAIGQNKWNKLAAYGTSKSIKAVDSISTYLESITGIPISFVKTTYTYSISTTRSSFDITPKAEMQELTDVYINDILVPDSSAKTVSLNSGTNTISIVVREKMNNSTKTYIINVTKSS